MLRSGLRFLLLCFLPVMVHAQDFRFKHYRVENGLPGDLIKAVTQDDLGFLWIATDDGIVRYDGYQFKTYKSAFQSQYIKNFFRTSDGRLLVVADLELSEIIHTADTIVFKRHLRGARNATDTTIWYPKLIYEDEKNNIWLAEPQSVVRLLNDNQFKRYDFGLENRSPVFTRSYFFFEDEAHQLFALSYHGKLFKYFPEKDEFQEQSVSFPFGISQIATDQGRLYLGTQEGVFVVSLENVLASPTLEWAIQDVTHIFFNYSEVWISTNAKSLYRKKLGDKVPIRVQYDFDRIESVYSSDENDLWISTQRGLVLAQSNLFKIVDEQSREEFVEAMTESIDNDNFYYCNRSHLIELSKSQGVWTRKVLYHNREGYFQSMAYGNGRLWASNDFSVLQFQEGRLAKSWNFQNEGRFINDIFLDRKNRLWLSQATNTHAIVLAEDGKSIQHYAVPLLPGSNINLIREGHHGMYAGSNGKTGYLFFKEDSAKVFRNVSLPLDFEPQSDFNVTDIVIQKDAIWLATTEGLLKYTAKKIVRVDIGELFRGFAVSSVEAYNDSTILFSNALGLIRYDTRSGEYWLFDEASGLPSNSINARGIYIDRERNVWIGSSMGLACADISTTQGKTRVPHLANAIINGISSFPNSNKLIAPYGTLLDLYFSAITFPENKIIFQWREPSVDSSWHAMQGRELTFSSLPSGDHTLEVRTKKNTGLSWSDPLSIHITIGKPFWLEINFILFIVIILVIISLVSYAFGIYFMNQRRKQLERLIQQRTYQLQMANNELLVRNSELDRFVYSASHDLSAPLKSILGLINISKLENPPNTILTYLAMMDQTVKKLEHFINEVVAYSRNARMPVKLEEVEFVAFVNAILEDHQFAPDFGLIHFKIETKSSERLCVDTMRLKIILNNLISNAIKFHRSAEEVEPCVTISLEEVNKEWKLTVSDNGKGIPPDHLDHIFTMFYRAHETSSGSGLGLYIMKEAIEKMSGRVEVQSKVAEGTTFHVFLPKRSLHG